MAFSSSSQNLEMAMLSSFWSRAFADILCSLACFRMRSRYSGCRVLRMSKKYCRGGPFPAGYVSGKNLMNSASFLKSGHSALTESSS